MFLFSTVKLTRHLSLNVANRVMNVGIFIYFSLKIELVIENIQARYEAVDHEV